MQKATIVIVLAIAGFAAALLAEVPPIGPEEKKKLASHIVDAKVVQVFAAQEDSGKGFVNTVYAIEVTIVRVDKGEKVEAGQTLFVKAWRASKRPSGWVGPSGQYEIPKPGDAVQLFMTQTNSAYQALSPNGIEVVKP